MAALTTALIVGSALAAGGAVASGAIQAHAAGKAADTQAAAGHEALNVQRDMYNTSRGDLMPYMNTGAQANGVLADVMGMQAPAPAAPTGGGLSMGPDGRMRPPNSPTVGQAMPRPGSMPPSGGGMPGGMPPQGSQGGTAPQNTSGYVLMRAPTGEQAQVAPNQVETAIRRGAVRV